VRRSGLVGLVLAMTSGWTMAAVSGGNPSSTDQVLEATGARGGLIVHVGCGPSTSSGRAGKLTADLGAGAGCVVQGLDADAANVVAARAHIQSRGLYGKVTVRQWKSGRLPYADNLVNAIVVTAATGAPADGEIMRVLAPEGVAYIQQGGGPARRSLGEGGWTKKVKPRPRNIDEWTHFLHGPDNNAVARDTVAAPPHHMQWVGGPRWARTHDHLGSVSALVSSGGRVFAIADEGSIAFAALPSKWFLHARDAFSGVLLWKRPIAAWEGNLRAFRSGPPDLPRRLVAVGDRVYVTLGYGEPVAELDAATGKTLRTYDRTAGTEEIILHDNVLYLLVSDPAAQQEAAKAQRRGSPYPGTKKHLMAVSADTGKLVWSKKDDVAAESMPLTLAVDGGRAFFQNADHLVCLDAKTGRENWTAARPVVRKRLGWSTPTVVVHGDVVISADRAAPGAGKASDASGPIEWNPSRQGGNSPVGEMIAFSVRSGKRLWSAPAREAYNAPPDVLITGGMVWSGILVKSGEPGITKGLDVKTGRVRKTRPADKEFFTVGMGHHRCYRNRATSRYLVLGRSGVEWIDLSTGKGVADHWVRGTCQYGTLPCNGMIYAPPHSCACYIEAKLNGFNALAPKRSAPMSGPQLTHGLAYGKSRPASATDGDWPTYRCDAARTGRAAATIPAKLGRNWAAEIGGRLSSVVVAGGKLFVASVDTHTVHALDAATGKPVWTFTAGGRVDSPPTVYKGLVLFGSADGCVYCLTAADGELVWKFRGAPDDRQVIAYEQLESAWPAHGSVLVQDGVAYFVVGRTPYLDGGMWAYGLDSATGKILHKRHLTQRDSRTGLEPQNIVKGTGMSGMLPDVLSCQDGSIYMRHKRFDKRLNDQPADVPHLFGPGGFVDDAWWHRTYWMIGVKMQTGYGGWPKAGSGVPAGRLIVCDGDTVYGFGRKPYTNQGGHVGLNAEHRLFAAGRRPETIKAPPVPAKKPAKKKRRPGGPRSKVTFHWEQPVPPIVRAMLKSGDALFVAGPPDSNEPAERQAAMDNERGGLLVTVSAADGRVLSQLKLDAPPVFDSMAAAGGRLYLATTDGKVLCFTASR